MELSTCSSGVVDTTLPSLGSLSRSQRFEGVTGTVNDGGGNLTSSSVARISWLNPNFEPGLRPLAVPTVPDCAAASVAAL